MTAHHAPPVIQVGERGGIPLLWIDADGEPEVALAFRVGLVDEAFARAGITHLVEHLALHRLDDLGHPHNGFVALDQCVFTAQGDADELVAYLHAVAAGLTALPIDRLDLERGVLEAEAESAGNATPFELAHTRYGLAAFGRRGLNELGLRSLTADDLVAWSAQRFTKGAAAICWIGPEPPQFTLDLPTGDGAPPIPPPSEPIIPLPFATTGSDGSVSMAVTTQRTMAGLVASDVLQRRLNASLRTERGLVYWVDRAWGVLTGGLVHLSYGTDVSGGRAAEIRQVMLAELDRLADETADGDGVTPEELELVRRENERSLLEPDARTLFLLDAALAVQAGEAVRQPADLLADLAAVDAAAVSQALWHARETLVVHSPEVITPLGKPFHSDLDRPQAEPITDGRQFVSGGLLRSRRSVLTIGDRGMTVTAPGEPEPLTLEWARIAAVTRERDGDYYFTSVDTSWFVVNPRIFKGEADEVKALIERYLDPATLVPAPGAAQIDAVEEAAIRDLKKPSSHRQALDVLPAVLEPAEELRQLFAAITGMKAGLLAVTDQRSIFLYVDDVVDEVPHWALRSVQIESSMKGDKVILDADPEPRDFWGFDRKEEPVELRDLLRAQPTG